jgi:cyanate lyase
MKRYRTNAEMIAKVRLAQALSRGIADRGLSWQAAAAALGLDSDQLADLLAYRFRQKPEAELRRLIERLAA